MNCAADISRGSRNDSDQHRKKKKHINNVVANTKNEKNKVIFFSEQKWSYHSKMSVYGLSDGA